MPETLGFLKVDEKGRTTIPQEMRRRLGLNENSLMRVDRSEDGSFELVPSAVIPNDQLWFHSPEMKKRIAHAEESRRNGKVTRVNGPEEAQAHLDRLKAKKISGAANS